MTDNNEHPPTASDPPVPKDPDEAVILDDEDIGPSPDGLSLKQEQAIVALLAEPTIPKAASCVKVGSRTLYRWLRDPVFSRVYRRTRREAFSQAVALTQRYAVVAVNTLARLMTDAKSPAHVRVTAAAALLRFGQEGIELDDLAARVEALEQATEANSDTKKGHVRPFAA